MSSIKYSFLVSIFFLLSSFSYAQDSEQSLPPVKGIFVDVGYGPAELGIGAGLRYWIFSAELWLGGLTVNTPNYAMQSPQGVSLVQGQPLPVGYEEESYTTTVIGFDAGVHYDITPFWSVFGQVGFYSSTDTLLARDINENTYYRYSFETESGIAFGLGGEYAVTDQILIGAGYHSRRGGFLRLTYAWW